MQSDQSALPCALGMTTLLSKVYESWLGSLSVLKSHWGQGKEKEGVTGV